jgi:hypothetical protein
VALWICGSAVGGCLAQNLLPNSTFEQGKDQPAGWTLTAGKGRRIAKAHENQSALMVQGTGQSQVFWRTEPLPLKSESLYRLAFMARWERTNAEGVAIAGVSKVNRDFRLGEAWARYDYTFSAPAAEDPRDFVHLGEWHVAGSVYFADVSLRRVESFSRQIAPGVELGEGESIQGGTYRFNPDYKWSGANYHRPLVLNRANFNTDRIVFLSGSELIYKLGIKGVTQDRAKVSVTINYHSGGMLQIEAGLDRTNWSPAARLEGASRTAQAVNMPASLFPADELFVRLSCRGPDANLQVNRFEYESHLTKPVPDARGATAFTDAGPAANAN